MRSLTLGAAGIAVVVLTALLTSSAEAAVQVGCTPDDPTCHLEVTSPGSERTTKPSSNGSSSGGTCTDTDGQPISCYDDTFGSYDQSDHCYYQLLEPQPPASDPAWGGHYPNGAIYEQTCVGIIGTGGGWVWRASAPATVTPEQLARRALATLRIPSPVMRRSPTEANSDHGTPYTWVHMWTWFWTDSGSWRTLDARAAAGSVWAQVTVRPTALVIAPGDGGTAVRCAGPGRAWRASDGNNAPSEGGCGYRYPHVTESGTVTARMTIEWSVTWTGSGGAGGTLPVMRTSATSQFAVEQIQVVTR